MGSTACVSGIRMECPGITVWFRGDSGTNQFKAGKYVVGIGIKHTSTALRWKPAFTATW